MGEFGSEDIHRQAGLEASNRADMTACAVIIFDKPTEGSFDSFVGFALGEECVLRGGAGEFHGDFFLCVKGSRSGADRKIYF